MVIKSGILVGCVVFFAVALQVGRKEAQLKIETNLENWPRVSVSIKNPTNNDVRVWKDSNSWGYKRLSFAIVLKDGSLFSLQRKNQDFTTNWPNYSRLNAKNELRYEVDLSDGWWDREITMEMSQQIQFVAAIFHIDRTLESQEHGAWSGTILEEWKQVPYTKDASRH